MVFSSGTGVWRFTFFHTVNEHTPRHSLVGAFMTNTRWSVARAFPPAPLKIESFRLYTKVECIECNETWRGSRWINYLSIGYYFIPFDCYCDVTNDVRIWHQN